MKSFNTSFTGVSNLWLISQGPKHGYELIKEVKRLAGHKLKPGVLYSLCARKSICLKLQKF